MCKPSTVLPPGVEQEQRQTAIQNARQQWEVSQGGIMLRTSRMVRAAMPDLYASHAGSYAPPHTDSYAPPHADTHADTASARDTREAQLTYVQPPDWADVQPYWADVQPPDWADRPHLVKVVSSLQFLYFGNFPLKAPIGMLLSS